MEHMRQDSLLDLYYQNSELLEYNMYAGLIAEQIAFRYPLIKILEIGMSAPPLQVTKKY